MLQFLPRLLKLASSLYIGSVHAVYPHYEAESSLCTDSNWFLGYNYLAELYYSAFDVHPSLDYFVVGGSKGEQGSLQNLSAQYEGDGRRRRLQENSALAQNSQGAVILLYKKLAGEPTQVLSVGRSLTLNGDGGGEHQVEVLGVSAIRLAASSDLKVSGVFSTDNNQLLFFKASFLEEGSQPVLTIFSLDLKMDSHYCYQDSRDLFGFGDSNGVDFFAYFDCDQPRNYFLTIYDGLEDSFALKDTIYFRQISELASLDGALTASEPETQNWYLSRAASLSPGTLSWTGHGHLGESNFLYLETVSEQQDGTFEHHSLILFSLEELATSYENAYPVSLLQVETEKWAVVAEVDESQVLVIQGISVDNPNTEYYTVYSNDKKHSLRVAQAIAVGDGVQMLLQQDGKQFLVTKDFVSGEDGPPVIQIGEYNSHMGNIADRISFFWTDQDQKIYGIAATGGVGFIIQQPTDPEDACIQFYTSSEDKDKLDKTSSEPLVDLNQKDAIIAHGDEDLLNSELIYLTLAADDDEMAPGLTAEHYVRNPCQLRVLPEFETFEKTIYATPDDILTYLQPTFTPTQACPNGTFDSIAQADGSEALVTLTVTKVAKLHTNCGSFCVFKNTWSVDAQNQIAIETGYDKPDEFTTYSVSFATKTYDDYDDNYRTAKDEDVKFPFREAITVCKNYLVMPDEGSLDTNILVGGESTISLESITNRDCEYELSFEVTELSDDTEEAMPVLSLEPPQFLVIQERSSSSDYTHVEVSQAATLLVNTLETEITTISTVQVTVTATVKLNDWDTQTQTFIINLKLHCDALLSPVTGPLSLNYTVTESALTQTYLKSESRACQMYFTRFETSLTPDGPFIALTSAAEDLTVTVESSDLALSDTTVDLLLREINERDESIFLDNSITISLLDPCRNQTVTPVSTISHEQIDSTLLIEWEPFQTLMPDWCLVRASKVAVDGKDISSANTLIDTERRMIEVDLSDLTASGTLEVWIIETITLLDGSVGESSEPATYSVSFIVEPPEIENPFVPVFKEFEPDSAEDSADDVPDWVKDLLNTVVQEGDDDQNGEESQTEEAADEEEAPIPEFVFTPTWADKIPARKPQPQPELELQLLEVKGLSISTLGLLTIRFTKPLIVPEQYINLQQKRKSEDFYDGISELIALEVASDQYEHGANETSIDTFFLTRFEGTEIDIQVNFTNLQHISVDLGSPEELFVTFLQPTVFSDSVDELQLNLEPRSQFNLEIVPQMTIELFEQVQAFDQAIEKPMEVFSQATLATNLALAYGLKYMWGLANMLQFIIFMDSWKINVDPFAKSLIQQLKKLSLFEFVDTEPATDFVKETFLPSSLVKDTESTSSEPKKRRQRFLQEESSDSSDPVDSDYAEADDQPIFEQNSAERFGSDDFLSNSGMMILLALLLLLLIALLLGCRILLRKSAKVRRIVSKIGDKIFCNALIRFALQSTLKLQIAAATVLVLAKDEDSMPTSAIGTIIFFNVIPLVFAVTLFCQRDALEQQNVNKRIGSLYMSLNPRRVSWCTLMQPSVFMIRRSLFVLVTFMLVDSPGTQVVVFISISVAYIGYLGHFVEFADNGTRWFEMTNECFFLLISYLLLLFTSSGDIAQPQRAQLGIAFLSILGLLLLVNMIVIVRANVRNLCRSLSLRKLKKHHAKVMKERSLALGAVDGAIALNAHANMDDPERQLQIKKVLDQEIERIKREAKEKIRPANKKEQVIVKVQAIEKEDPESKSAPLTPFKEKNQLETEMKKAVKFIIDEPEPEENDLSEVPSDFLYEQQDQSKANLFSPPPITRLNSAEKMTAPPLSRDRISNLTTKRSSLSVSDMRPFSPQPSSLPAPNSPSFVPAPSQSRSPSSHSLFLDRDSLYQEESKTVAAVDSHASSLQQACKFAVSEVSYRSSQQQQDSPKSLLSLPPEQGFMASPRQNPIEESKDSSFSSFDSESDSQSQNIPIHKTKQLPKSRFSQNRGQAVVASVYSNFEESSERRRTSFSVIKKPTYMEVLETRRLALSLVQAVTTMKKRTRESKSISTYERGISSELDQLPQE